MSSVILAHWWCAPCEVEGRDPVAKPACWNCGGEVTVTARPTVQIPLGVDAD